MYCFLCICFCSNLFTANRPCVILMVSLSLSRSFFRVPAPTHTHTHARTHSRSLTLSLSLSLCLCDIMWKNTVEPCRPQMTIWCVHIACWVTVATNTHSDYVILIAFPLHQWLYICSSVFRYIFASSVSSTSILCECVVWHPSVS